MDTYIADFSKHLKKAIEIGHEKKFALKGKKFQNVLICGLGGSGIGGSITALLLKEKCNIPILVNKDYQIPAFVDQNTLLIACSYSGNTEETLNMIKAAEQTSAEICHITSGGKLSELAKSKNQNLILIPPNFPPRAAFGYSFPQILFALEKYGIIDDFFVKEIQSSIDLLDKEEGNIKNEAGKAADKLVGKLAVIYSEARFEGVSIRFRQQLNENSKMLCWHHSIPEMNHNELVGWKDKNKNLVPVFFSAEDDFFRNMERMKYSQKVIKNYTEDIIELQAKGSSFIAQTLYFIHLGDWISFYIAEQKSIDAVEVNVITGLKNMLSEI